MQKQCEKYWHHKEKGNPPMSCSVTPQGGATRRGELEIAQKVTEKQDQE